VTAIGDPNAAHSHTGTGPRGSLGEEAQTMGDILRYVLVDRFDREGDQEYDTLDEAIAAAGDDDAVVERTYEYGGSELVWTPDGGQSWPPKPCKRRRDREEN
jgi:hypothetical protein